MGTSAYMIERHYSHFIPTLSAEKLAGKRFGKRDRKKIEEQIVFIPEDETDQNSKI